MSLKKYKAKRSFKVTTEPIGGKPSADQLRFVIQKHDASHLHYDFRLEMEGVLKSWAVPKGPSTDPSVKRLAMMVEDHPYDYRSFEGIIPKGQYGGGTVIVWDEGTYQPAEGSFASKTEMDKALLQQLKKGKLVVTMEGQKVKGDYALVKSSYQGENSWLLMKVKDKFAKTSDITKKDKSVLSGKTITQVEKTSDNIYGQTKKPKVKKSATTSLATKAAKKTTPKAIAKKSTQKKSPLAGKKSTFPVDLEPMLATLVDKPFDDPDWLYEVKWDGYRTVAYIRNGKVELRSRNNKSFNEKFYPIHAALKNYKYDAVLDGEIIVASEQGLSNFGDLQNWRSEADGELKFYVFDIMYLNGRSLMELPLTERRAILLDTVSEKSPVHISQTFDASGTSFFEVGKQMGLEGIMAKKADSEYGPGVRSKEWLKIKIAKRQEMVIGGYTKNEGSSKKFSSLLVGVFDKKKLRYTGKVGTGFSDALQIEMMKQFKKLETSNNPFIELPDINKPSRFRPNPPKASAVWLKPELVCEVSFTEMTSDGVMRHPSFEGMRIDKKASSVKEEKAASTTTVVKSTVLHDKKLLTNVIEGPRKTLLNPTDETQERAINGNKLKFTNLSKIYWPKEKFTKRDMLNYYYQVAPVMVPYLKDRPQSLNRFPNGINGMSFYQKDVTGKVPNWIHTFPYHSEADGEDKNFMVAMTEADLLYMASLGCIEINPWSSRRAKPDHPDWCIIDLDPDKNHFDKVIEAALITHQILDAAGADNYVKTSGSTGIHIYIPLGAKYTYEQSKEFARVIVKLVHAEIPSYTSIERATKNRKGKMYLDFLQNRSQATLAAPYSVRPKPGATVSAPLHWEEVKKGLKMQDFTIQNMPARIQLEGDFFKPVLGKGINLDKVLKQLLAMAKSEL
ncbi:MAG: DNA ligase D [Chitinophagaceae bacterium]|nr:DNA ligase D [Chitinophagaceae bacterium]